MNSTNDLDHLLCQIGLRLRAIRNTRGEKLYSVASSLGVTHPVISKIENGSYKSLKLSLLIKLTDYYSASLEEVLSERPGSAEPVSHLETAALGNTSLGKVVLSRV